MARRCAAVHVRSDDGHTPCDAHNPYRDAPFVVGSQSMSASGLTTATAEPPAARTTTTGAALVLATVCADFLGAALDACAAEHATDQAAPTVTIRLTEAAGAEGVRGVRCLTVDVLGDVGRVASPPCATPELSRLVTHGNSAREWATSLWRAGATLLHVRVISPSHALDSFSYVFADEESADTASRSWALPLQQSDSAPLCDELRGKCGFQLQLELCSSDKPPPPCAVLERLLSALVRSTMLLAPAANLELEVERASCTPVQLEVLPLAEPSPPPPPPTAVLVSVRATLGAASTLERLKQAAAAHLSAEQHAKGVQGDFAGSTSNAAAQAAGFAQLATSTHGKRVIWTVTAVVASSCASDEPGAEPANVAAADELDRPGVTTRQASVYCFADSVLQMRPPAAVLDALNTKSTMTAVKAATGLQLCGCEACAEYAAPHGFPAPQSAPCATLRFAECDSLAMPALITFHRSSSVAQPLSSAAKLPTLSRKREAALVKAALLASLRDFKCVTGGGTSFERGLRTHGFSAVASAIAKVAAAGGQELQSCATALANQLSEVGPAQFPVAEAAPEDDQRRMDATQQSLKRTRADTLEQTVVAALLRVLAGEPSADTTDPPAPETEPEASVGGISQDTSSREHPHDDPPGDDEDVFPQRRRLRSPSPALEDAMKSEARAELGSDDGWFM